MTIVNLLTSVMEDSMYLATAVFGLLLVCLLQLWLKYRNFPPGPWGLPIVGYGPFLAKDMLNTLKTFKDKYGDVCSVNFGARIMVIINTHDLMKEVYVKQGDKSTGCLQGFSIGTVFCEGPGTNLFISEGENWKEQKRFLTSNLREFGLGKMKMEKNIQLEVEHFLHFIRDLDGAPCDWLKSRMLSRVAANVLSVLVFGSRFDYENEKLKRLIEDLDDFLSSFSQTAGVEMFPILRFFPDRISGLGPIRRAKTSMVSFIREMVREHEESYDPENLRDMMDVYLKANKEVVKAKGKEIAPYTMTHLVGNTIALFAAGTDDMTSLITWTIMLAALNPDCQKKIQEEIDKHVGRQRLPSWMDKNNLVYVEAFLLEVQRVGAILPLSMVHSTYEDMTIGGYHIPAKTHLTANYWLVYTDPKIWGDPDNFRPERFIDDGKINRLRDYVMAFGLGKRTCIGEPLAKMEIFLIFTSVLQSFDLSVPPGSEAKTYAAQPDVRRLTSCTVCAVPRD